MKSLRARLIVAFALVAIVPIAISLVMWTRAVERTVRGDADFRLDAALRRAQADLHDRARDVDARIQRLADDASLRRLFLVGTADRGELREYLLAQRRLLGLRYLWIEDLDGAPLVNADEAAADSGTGRPFVPAELDRTDVLGPRLAAVRSQSATTPPFAVIDCRRPIEYVGERQAVLRGGVALDEGWAGSMDRAETLGLAIFAPGDRLTTTTLGQPPPVHAASPDPAERVNVGPRGFLARRDSLTLGAPSGWTLAAYYATTDLDATLRALRLGAAGLGALALAVAIALGLLFSLQLSRPVERLAAFSNRIARGEWDEPLREEGVRELRTLVGSLERMRGDLASTRERLAAGERQAAYGQMARKVAHEIKNPLTPIAISIADLKRSFDQRRPEFPEILDQATRTIGDEVERLQQLIRDFSELGRFPAPRIDWMDLGALGRDLASLYGHEVSAGRLALTGFGGGPAAPRLRADRDQLRQVLVNLVQNALDAVGPAGHVALEAREAGDHVEILVRDDGPGLSAEQRAHLFVPGFTTKSSGSGLGLTIVERIVTDHHGTIAVDASPAGTTFTIRLPRNAGA